MGDTEASAQQKYFPCLSTRAFEMMAYRKCASAVKASMLPVITLTRQREAVSFDESFDLVQEAAEGNAVIVDFDPTPRLVTSAQEAAENRRRKAERRVRLGGKEPRARTEKELARYDDLRRRTERFNEFLAGLTNPDQGLPAWISKTASYPNLIPVIRLVSEAAMLRQLEAASQAGNAVAFRIDPADPTEVSLAGIGLRSLVDPQNSFLLLDSGDVRGRASLTAQAADAALRSLRSSAGEAVEIVRKVAIGGSFPSSSLRDLPRLLEMEERRHFVSVSGSWNIDYGDHASLPPRSARAGGNGWFPHVDMVLRRHWRIELEESNSDAAGYVRCAATVTQSDQWPERTQCWGTSVIETVAEGNTTVDSTKFVVPGPWIAVRANQHISSMAIHR